MRLRSAARTDTDSALLGTTLSPFTLTTDRHNNKNQVLAEKWAWPRFSLEKGLLSNLLWDWSSGREQPEAATVVSQPPGDFRRQPVTCQSCASRSTNACRQPGSLPMLPLASFSGQEENSLCLAGPHSRGTSEQEVRALGLPIRPLPEAHTGAGELALRSQ